MVMDSRFEKVDYQTITGQWSRINIGDMKNWLGCMIFFPLNIQGRQINWDNAFPGIRNDSRLDTPEQL